MTAPKRLGLGMPRKTENVNENPAPTTGQVFPRMLTLEQVQDALNVKGSLVYALVRSGELPAGQFGGRGYLAYLLRLMRILPGIAGEERRMPREVSVRSVSIVERRCARVAA